MEYWARPTASVRGSLTSGIRQPVTGTRTLDPQLAHVGQVEQARRAPDLGVLLEDAPVLDRHRPAAEVDEPGAQRHDAPRSSGVWRSAGSLGHVPPARGTARATTSRSVGKLMSDLGILDGDPADLVELVVVERQVATHGLHQVVVDGLVDARALLDEEVLDGPDGRQDADLEPGLLLDLAQGGLLHGLVAVGRSLGQRPGDAVALPAPAAEHQLGARSALAQDHPAGRRRPRARHPLASWLRQPRHGVAAARLGRWTHGRGGAPAERGDPGRQGRHSPHAGRGPGGARRGSPRGWRATGCRLAAARAAGAWPPGVRKTRSRPDRGPRCWLPGSTNRVRARVPWKALTSCCMDPMVPGRGSR